MADLQAFSTWQDMDIPAKLMAAVEICLLTSHLAAGTSHPAAQRLRRRYSGPAWLH